MRKIDFKKILIISFCFIVKISFSQSKKEQILVLNQKKDSLITVIETKKEQILALNQKKDSLITVIETLKNDISGLTSNLTIKNNDINEYRDSIVKNNIKYLNLSKIKTTDSIFMQKQIESFNLKIERLNFKIDKLRDSFFSNPESIIVINVKNKFNDHEIKIFWFPAMKSRYGEIVLGPAIIEFKNNGGYSEYVHDYNFGLPATSLDLNIDDGNNVIKINKSTIEIEFNDIIRTKVPDDTKALENFMFKLDINFDGTPELFTIGHYDAQREGDTFKPIFFHSDSGIRMYQNNHTIDECDKVFSNLDSMSEINTYNKTIKLRHSNGADSSFAEIYKWNGYCYKFSSKTNW